MEKCVAIIPARLNSKRIPKKNIKKFYGKPIVQYSIESALNTNIFSEIMVSTDSEEIADFSIECGASVPFLRTSRTSDDYASLIDVILEVIENYKNNGREFEYFCCILATAPFISPSNIKKAFNFLLEKNYDTVFCIQRYGYPIQRALRFKDDRICMLNKENYFKRSQDLETMYHD
ncbi:pseudaminic acid cytidylyltransferase, partial [bacterium]